MPRPHEGGNKSTRNGRWGEAVAVEHLRCEGYEIIGRNVRPCARDRRLEIDVIAYDRLTEIAVFVEVKQHRMRDARSTRLRSVTRRKTELLRRACRCWLLRNKWETGYRFDVIEVYGSPGERPEIDHVERVRLFEKTERFVRWDA